MAAVLKDLKSATAYDIVAWHKPVPSGIVLTAICSIWFVFTHFEYTLTTFCSRIITLVFIAGAAAAVTKRVTVQSSSDFTASMDKVYESARPHLTKAIDGVVGVLTWRDYALSAKCFVATLITALLGNLMSDTTLILLIVVVVFTVPAGYEHKKKEVDEVLKKVQEAVDKALSMIKTKTEEKKAAVEQQWSSAARKND